MKGNTLKEFIDDLITCGGPEKEFTYGNKYYIIQGDNLQPDNISGLRLDIYENNHNDAGEFVDSIFFAGNTYSESVEKFKSAKIFDNKTIYEVEQNIEVLFG